MSLINRAVFVLFTAMCMTCPVWAASNMYLKIIGVNGESELVACPDGICQLEGFTVGHYELLPCDQAGNPSQTHVVLYEMDPPEIQDTGSGTPIVKRRVKPIRMINTPGEERRHLGLDVRSNMPVTIKIKDVSAVKSDTEQ